MTDRDPSGSEPVGTGAATAPALAVWPPTDPRFRRRTATAVVGTGDDGWRRAREDVLRWRVKTRSGFAVHPDVAVQAGQRPAITAGPRGLRVHEPVEVVEVVDRPDRAGFAYRTLPGHPVRGEEAFVVHRDGDSVLLTVRSLTRRAPQQPWRALFPLLLVAQRVAHTRYLRALR